MNKCVKIYVEYFKKLHDKKYIFAACSENGPHKKISEILP